MPPDVLAWRASHFSPPSHVVAALGWDWRVPVALRCRQAADFKPKAHRVPGPRCTYGWRKLPSVVRKTACTELRHCWRHPEFRRLGWRCLVAPDRSQLERADWKQSARSSAFVFSVSTAQKPAN